MHNRIIHSTEIKISRWLRISCQKVLKFERASTNKFFAALENEKEVKDYLAESQLYPVKLGDNYSISLWYCNKTNAKLKVNRQLSY